MATQQHTVCAPAQHVVFLSTPENDGFLDSFNASVPDTPYMCSVCYAAHLDPRETPRHTVEGWHVCHNCIESCQHCNECLDDMHATLYGPVMRFSEWENDGRLSRPTCAMCAAGWLLSVWSGDMTFNAERASCEYIASIVARAFAGKVAA